MHCVRKDRSGRERLEEHNKDEISSLWWLRRPNQHPLKAESGTFVRAVPIFVQLHWFRLVQIGSDWFRLVVERVAGVHHGRSGRQVARGGAVGGWDSEAGGWARVYRYNTILAIPIPKYTTW